MLRFVLASLAGLLLGLACGEGIGGGGCCKMCTNSKPCGDSCIAYNQTCSKGGGCACSQLDADEELPLAADTLDEGGESSSDDGA
jgi:hypothetical protein